MGRKRYGLPLLAMLASLLCGPAKPQDAEVDLALVLAVDCSYSVDAGEHQLQMNGMSAALQSAEVLEAILAGPRQRIAVMVFQWADAGSQKIIVPWTVVGSAEDARRVGTILSQGKRAVPLGGTGMSAALLFGASSLASGPSAARRTIDVATDGRNNLGLNIDTVRDIVTAEGITINALAISNEWPTLDAYLELHVVGGRDSFVIKSLSYGEFGDAMRRKIVKEITGPGLT